MILFPPWLLSLSLLTFSFNSYFTFILSGAEGDTNCCLIGVATAASAATASAHWIVVRGYGLGARV